MTRFDSWLCNYFIYCWKYPYSYGSAPGTSCTCSSEWQCKGVPGRTWVFARCPVKTINQYQASKLFNNLSTSAPSSRNFWDLLKVWTFFSFVACDYSCFNIMYMKKLETLQRKWFLFEVGTRCFLLMQATKTFQHYFLRMPPTSSSPLSWFVLCLNQPLQLF